MPELPYQNLNKAETEELFTPVSRTLKRQLIKQGYTNQMSLYGVVTDKRTKVSEYRRIEIMLNCTPTEKIVHQIYEFFQDYIPTSKYQIWVYDKNLNAVKLVGAYK